MRLVPLGLLVFALVAQSNQSGEWRHYSRDLASSRYSPLDLLTRENISNVKVAWRWRSDNFSAPPEFSNESTPIMIGGTLYFTRGARRAVVAVDGATGATKWSWELNEGDRAAHAPRRDSGRGVAYWSSGAESRPRFPGASPRRKRPRRDAQPP